MHERVDGAREPRASERVRVVLCDDHPVVLDGLRAVFARDGRIDVVGVMHDGEHAVSLTCALAPDVLIVDLSLPGISGVEVTRHVAAECPTVRIIVLTVHEKRAYVDRLLAAGASGYVLKRSASQQLVTAVHAVAAGGVYVDPMVLGQILPAGGPGPAPQPSQPSHDEVLTTREEETLRRLAFGFSNKEVAAHLGITAKTVETHRANAMRKLSLRTRADLVRFAHLQGWLDEI